MKKEFIPYEEALAMQELGFGEECLAIYYKDDEPKKLLFSIEEKYSSNPEVAKHQSRNTIRDINFEKGWAIKVPLYQQAFRWFREKYNWNGWIDKGFTETFRYNICENNGSIIGLEGFDTYEEAELACLRKLIEIVKENKED